MSDRTKLFIDGTWVEPASTDRLDVENPSTESIVGSVPRGNPADVDAAVRAARGALPAWSALPPAARADHLRALHQTMSANKDQMVDTIVSELGTPRSVADRVQVGLPLTVLASYPDILQTFEFDEQLGNSLVTREPVGVVAAITPWNYPLHQIMAKVAAALAAGCTVVLKPAGLAPLNAFLLADAVEAAGLPAGVFNLISGDGAVAGEALVRHPDVDLVSFTGSVESGRRIAALTAERVTRTTLELGGKSANVILSGADLQTAVKVGVGNSFLNSGQTCSAWTRMLVPESLHDEAAGLAQVAAKRYPLGEPSNPDTRMGPVVSAGQRARIRHYIELGKAEGADLVAGGAEQPDELPVGYYVRPTIFAGVRRGMTIAQEEIFGPVLSIMPYRDETEALEIANDTLYGLAGGVWCADEDRALAFARNLRTGQVDINGGRFNPLAPFGGYKQSGHGRELGRYGLEEFLEIKSIQR